MVARSRTILEEIISLGREEERRGGGEEGREEGEKEGRERGGEEREGRDGGDNAYKKFAE